MVSWQKENNGINIVFIKSISLLVALHLTTQIKAAPAVEPATKSVSAGSVERWQQAAIQKAPAVLQCELRLKEQHELQKTHWRAQYPLELGGSLQSGQYQENSPLSLNPQQFPETRRDGLTGWDLELSQRINLTGARAKSQAMLEARLRYQELECQRVRQETRLLVAEGVYSIQLLTDLAGDLRMVLGRLERIKRALAGSYRDPAMGNYIIHTIDANLREHRQDLSSIELEKLGKQNNLSLLTGGDRFALPAEAPTTAMLPPLAHNEPRRALELHALESQLRVQEGHLIAAGLSEPLTVFASGGQKEIGPAGNALRTYERESFVRAGLRVPVFSGGPELRARRSARQSEAREALLLKEQEAKLQAHFALLKKDYTQLREQVLVLLPLRKQAPAQINLLERALLLGRISYGDFWNGHELWHKQEVYYARLTMEALQKLREISVLAGDSND